MPVKTAQIDTLPVSFFEAPMESFNEFGIGFLRVGTARDAPHLLGSGILVTTCGQHAILTAHHVLEILPKTGRLGLVLESSLRQTTVDTAGLVYKEIARGTVDREGPDLGAVILPAPIAATLSSKKVFYNLDLRREKLLNNPPPRDFGVWFVNGFVDERTVTAPGVDGYSSVRGFFNLSAAGGPDEEASVVGEFDYYEMPVFYPGPNIPRSFGGMSGGGLWQMEIHDDNGVLKPKTPPWLSGVVFYQEETRDNRGAVKCHGRLSVYKAAYEAIATGKW
jgi:hypothetical protein